MKNAFFFSIFLLGTMTVSLLMAADLEAPFVTKENAGTFYHDPSFTRLTKEPLFVAPITAMLCASPSPETMAREREKTGPHYQARIHLYANPPALEVAKNKLGTFPVNSVVIKEKLDTKGNMKAVGGMIKRTLGYDKENGDWEYFYFSQEDGFSSGKMQNCIDCHRGAADSDYVYQGSMFGISSSLDSLKSSPGQKLK